MGWNTFYLEILPFFQAYYALMIRGQLQPGESVLIHAGSGATGMSAISIALSLKCEVFTTVSTIEKRQYLLKMFPQLKQENFGMNLVSNHFS